MLFSLCAVVSACSDENDKGTSTATLEIVEEFVDFKENGESQTYYLCYPQYGKRTAEHYYYRKGSRVIGENNCTSIGNG